ncbi:MAG: GHKL domain-containing protein [Lachnospiraceae bacterium]|nr:GHKL domain-containing protein [Lachnospiraceae bacterium]
MALWVVDYLINFLSYYIVYRWILCVPFRKNIFLHIGVPVALCPVVIGLFRTKVIGYNGVVIAFAALLGLLLLVEERHIMVTLAFPIAFFASGVISILVTYLLSFVTGIPYPEFMASMWWQVASESVFPIVFFVLFFTCRRLREERDTLVFSPSQYMTTLLGSVCLFIIISISQGMMKGKAVFVEWIRPLSIALVIVAIVFVALVLWQSSVEKRALRYKMENEYYQLCLKRQETHIREIVENDQKIRRFRHDVNAHLTALEQCVQTNDMQQLKSYVERMRTETQKLEVQKFTGIGVVDAIISEWYQKAKAQEIQWEWDGGLLGQTEMEPFDLCVIFSNLLSNAVEAAEQVEEGKERKISVSCGSFMDRICIRVSNTCRDTAETEKRHGTTKSDYRNHGFGLMNIRNTVAKVNGEFSIQEEPGLFRAEIVL